MGCQFWWKACLGAWNLRALTRDFPPVEQGMWSEPDCVGLSIWETETRVDSLSFSGIIKSFRYQTHNLWLEGKDIQQKWRVKISKEGRVKARVTQGGSADCQQGFLDTSKRLKIVLLNQIQQEKPDTHWWQSSVDCTGVFLVALSCV